MSLISRLSQLGVIAGWAGVVVFNGWLCPAPDFNIQENNTLNPPELETLNYQYPYFLERRDIYPPNGVAARPDLIETCALFPTEDTIFLPICPGVQFPSLIVLHDVPLKSLTVPAGDVEIDAVSQVIDDGNSTINPTISSTIDPTISSKISLAISSILSSIRSSIISSIVRSIIEQRLAAEQLHVDAHRKTPDQFSLTLFASILVVCAILVFRSIQLIDLRAVREHLERKLVEKQQSLENEIRLHNEDLALHKAELDRVAEVHSKQLREKDQSLQQEPSAHTEAQKQLEAEISRLQAVNEKDAVAHSEALSKLGAEVQQLQEINQNTLKRSAEQEEAVKALGKKKANLSSQLSTAESVPKSDFEQLQAEKEKALEKSKKLGQDLDISNKALKTLKEVSGRDKTAQAKAEESFRKKESTATLKINDLEKQLESLKAELSAQQKKETETKAELSAVTKQCDSLRGELEDTCNSLTEEMLKGTYNEDDLKDSQLKLKEALELVEAKNIEIKTLEGQVRNMQRSPGSNLEQDQTKKAAIEHVQSEPDKSQDSGKTPAKTVPQQAIAVERSVSVLGSSTPKQDEVKAATPQSQKSKQAGEPKTRKPPVETISQGNSLLNIIGQIECPTETKVYRGPSKRAVNLPPTVATNVSHESFSSSVSAPQLASMPEFNISAKNPSEFAIPRHASRRSSAQSSAKTQPGWGHIPTNASPRSGPALGNIWASMPVPPLNQTIAVPRDGTRSVSLDLKAASSTFEIPSNPTTTEAAKSVNAPTALDKSQGATDAKAKDRKHATTNSKESTVSSAAVASAGNTTAPKTAAITSAENLAPSKTPTDTTVGAEKQVVSTTTSTSPSKPKTTPALPLTTTGSQATSLTTTATADSPIVEKIADLIHSISKDKQDNGKGKKSVSGPSKSLSISSESTKIQSLDSPASDVTPTSARYPLSISPFATTPVENGSPVDCDGEEEEGDGDDDSAEEEEQDESTKGSPSTSTGHRKKRSRPRGSRAGRKVQKQRVQYASKKEEDKIQTLAHWKTQMKEAKDAQVAARNQYRKPGPQ